MCGEKFPPILSFRVQNGSPPRVRGEVVDQPVRRFIHRITPACAGRSSADKFPFDHIGDHPRVCGEKLSF